MRNMKLTWHSDLPVPTANQDNPFSISPVLGNQKAVQWNSRTKGTGLLNRYCFTVQGAVRVNVRRKVHFPYCSNAVLVGAASSLNSGVTIALGCNFCPLVLKRGNKSAEVKCLETGFGSSRVAGNVSFGLKMWMPIGSTFFHCPVLIT